MSKPYATIIAFLNFQNKERPQPKFSLPLTYSMSFFAASAIKELLSHAVNSQDAIHTISLMQTSVLARSMYAYIHVSWYMYTYLSAYIKLYRSQYRTIYIYLSCSTAPATTLFSQHACDTSPSIQQLSLEHAKARSKCHTLHSPYFHLVYPLVLSPHPMCASAPMLSEGLFPSWTWCHKPAPFPAEIPTCSRLPSRSWPSRSWRT